MRVLLVVWLAPIILLAGWYGFASNDLGPGMLSRAFHDRLFGLYGSALGIEPATIPALVARALVVDSAILWALVALKKRGAIRAWWRKRNATRTRAQREAESLSSAP